jgi:anti-sigma factor RsiW
MNCQETEENLPDYLDGILHPHDQEQVQTHLMGCERCQAQQASWGQFVSRLKQATANDPGDAFFVGLSARVKQAIEAEQKRMAPARQPVKKEWFRFSFPSFQMELAYACAALMIATVGLSLFFKNRETRILTPEISSLQQAVHQADLSDSEEVAVLFDMMDDGDEDISDDIVTMTLDL